jgi:ParB family chromosome partitioning protein
MEQALIENIQRQDLNPLEEAYAMDRLMKEHGLTQEQLSKKLGKSRPAIANTVRLMSIDASLQDYIRNGDLTAGHARALLALPSLEDQRKAADIILSKELSVRETEEYVRRILTPKPEKIHNDPELDKNSAAIALSTKDVERKLTKYFGTKVKLKVKPETQNGSKIKLKGKGFPVYKSKGHFGDLFITYNIEIPTDLTERQKELFYELSKSQTKKTAR